jgi:hypothetical protein
MPRASDQGPGVLNWIVIEQRRKDPSRPWRERRARHSESERKGACHSCRRAFAPTNTVPWHPLTATGQKQRLFLKMPC